MTVAALFVDTKGCYSGLDGVEMWDEAMDARKYPGPHPGVYHPPCARWGRYWSGGPSAKVRRKLGDDAGCFDAALKSVECHGGVLEHPEASHAWKRFGIVSPPKTGGWVRAGLWRPGWTCCVYQGHYGHRAPKATWLYAVGCELPVLTWGAARGTILLDEGFHSAEERRRAVKTGSTQRMAKRERMATPVEFRDILLDMARSVRRAGVPARGPGGSP